MADQKISQLTGATTPLTGTELLPIVQAGSTKKVAVSDLTAGRAINTTELTLTTGNLVIGTAGKGIDFSADGQSAGMSSELLDDYEEGTWTPALVTGAGESITYATQAGIYTKIGRQVFCQAKISITSAATYGGSNHLQISGLPFGAARQEMTFSYGSEYGSNSLLQVGDVTGGYPTGTGASTFFLQRGAYGGTTDVLYRVALLNTTGKLYFICEYTV